MLQACAQAVDFKGGHHFGEGQKYARLYSLQLALQKDAILTLADGMDTLG